MSWDLKFAEPIAMAGWQRLVTLGDAAIYISTLSKSEQQECRWKSAVYALTQAAENGAPIDSARLGMAHALGSYGDEDDSA